MDEDIFMCVIKKHDLKFIFITACIEEDFFKPLWRGVEDAARALGVKTAIAGVRDIDNDAQIRLVRDAIQQGYDGIALNIIHPTAFNEVISEALNSGIPVIGFNVDSKDKGNRRMSCVCQNSYKAGKLLAKEIYPLIKPEVRVLATLHSKGISALEERLAGIQEGLCELDLEWIIAVTGTNSKEAANVALEVLRKDSQICAVIGTGQADTEGAAIALSENFRQRDIVLAGFDLSPQIMQFIKLGIITATIDQQPYVQGFYPVVQLVHYCRYGIRPSDIDSGATVINKKNIISILEAQKNEPI
jgi:simple sugar transport system substrate-binding protein